VLIGIWTVLIFYIGKENKKRSDEGGQGQHPDDHADKKNEEKKTESSKGDLHGAPSEQPA
jgi:hypothetical protein